MTIIRNTIGAEIKSAAKEFLTQTFLGSDYPSQNILHNYRIFTYRITLAVVSAEEHRTQSYKQNGFDYVLFSSHGKIPEGGPTTTVGGNKTLADIQKFTSSLADSSAKKYDFFLEDLQIKSYMSSVKDWATDIKLKVIEPYSIDTFLTAIATGVGQKRYRNLDKSTVFVIKIDFIGYPENSELPEVVPYSTRYYPVYFKTFKANLSQQGTTYDITCAPINDAARLDDLNVIQQTFKASGNTVGEVLKSFEDSLNSIRKDSKEYSASNTLVNSYKIVFVNDQGAIIDSPIAAYKMFDPLTDKGNREFSKNKKSYIEVVKETDATTNSEERKITFNIDGRDGIINIVDNIINDSYYVMDKIRTEFKDAHDGEGFVDWWRVTATPSDIEWDPATNKNVREVLIKIAPRKVQYSKLVSLFKPTYVTPAKDFEKMTARKYEWLYTGNNKDIINFNVTFNQMWFKMLTGKLGRTTATPGESKDNAKNQTNPTQKSNAEPVASDKSDAVYPGSAQVCYREAPDPKVRDGGETTPMASIARDINALVNNPYEQVEADVEIMGDPMWLGTQFIDNSAVVGAGKSKLFTNDGGVALRTVDPIIRILAYSPRDFDSNGFLSNEQDGTRDLSKLSAYYTVREVDSSFSGGVFKQKLKCNRASQQDMRNLTPSEEDRFSMKQIDLSIRK